MEKRDLRVQKTYTALFNSFQSLLKEKKFEDITVRELCDRATIRTATFYKHFTDKYDFAAFMIKELRSEFEANNIQNKDSNGINYYLDVIRNGLILIHEYETLVCALDDNNMIMLISEPERNSVRQDLLTHLKADQANGHDLAAEPELLTDILIGTMNQAGRWWLAHQDTCEIDEMVDKLTVYVKRIIG